MADLPSPEELLPSGTAVRFDDGAVRLSLALEIYSVGAVLRTCYWLTDRCYVHLSTSPGHLEVTILAKAGEGAETNTLVWQFLNSLLDNQLRVSVQQETAGVREMVIAQAFANVDIMDDHGRPVVPGNRPAVDQQALTTWRPVP